VEIVAAVARIVEAGVAIGRDQCGPLGARGEVLAAVGGENRFEHAEVSRDVLREAPRRAGRQDEAATRGVLALQPCQHLGPVGKRCRIDVYATRDLLLQLRRPAQQPERHGKQQQRVVAQKEEQTLPEQVRRNQRPIKIDSERDRGTVRPGVHGLYR